MQTTILEKFRGLREGEARTLAAQLLNISEKDLESFDMQDILFLVVVNNNNAHLI
jgi:hypothetical protein